jgi:hypothetical protein
MPDSANIPNRVFLSNVLDKISKYRDAKGEEEPNKTSKYWDVKNVNKTLIKGFEGKELQRKARHGFEVTITMGVADSSVGITRYGLEGPGIESRWGRDFPHPSRPPSSHTQPSVRLLPNLFTADKAAGA